MGIEVLCFEGRPRQQLAGARLWEAIRTVGGAATLVTWQPARDADDAGRLAFRESPVLVGGRCRLARPADPAGMACRAYRSASGTHSRIAGQIPGVLTDAA
jgi:hypothetical protein